MKADRLLKCMASMVSQRILYQSVSPVIFLLLTRCSLDYGTSKENRVPTNIHVSFSLNWFLLSIHL